MSVLRAANLGLKFALELAALAAFAYWGATVGNGVGAVIVAIAAPLVAILLWGRFAAPTSEHRLHLRTRLPFEFAVFALAALVLLPHSALIAIVFAAAVIVNSLLLTLFRQWEA